MPENERAIGQSDLDSFTEKLDAWAKTLPENEQTLLRVVLAQAGSGGSSEVEGFSVSSDFGLLASALLGPAVANSFTAAGHLAAGDWGSEWIRDWTRTGNSEFGEQNL